MKITISGLAGSGKSTIAKFLEKELNLKHYSVGDFMREIAARRGMTLAELGKVAETDPSVDRELDAMQKALDAKDNFVLDSRLATLFVPSADVKFFLTCSDKVRAERIFKDHLVGRPGEKSLKTSQEVLSSIKEREKSEALRYKNYYHYDYKDRKHYDLVLDTSKHTIDSGNEAALAFVKKKLMM